MTRISRHAMVGRGGGVVVPRSESAVLKMVISKLRHAVTRQEWQVVRDVIADIAQLRGQVAEGYHRNHPLVIYGNPPMRVRRVVEGRIVGVLSDDVHEVRYTHVEDMKDYRHEFQSGVQMFAVERKGQRDVHLTHADGLPLWEDF